MDFDQWCDAVDAALRSQGRGFGVSQIDPGDLQTAFQNNVSPVIFARQANPQPVLAQPQNPFPPQPKFQTAPVPSMFVIRTTHLILSICGWLFWVLAVGVLSIWLVMLLGSASAKETSGITALTIIAGPLTFVYVLFLLALGGVWHWLAQMLALQSGRGLS